MRLSRRVTLMCWTPKQIELDFVTRVTTENIVYEGPNEGGPPQRLGVGLRYFSAGLLTVLNSSLLLVTVGSHSSCWAVAYSSAHCTRSIMIFRSISRHFLCCRMRASWCANYITCRISKRWAVVTTPPGGVRSIAMSFSVCLFVCMSTRSHVSKTYVQISRNYLHVLLVAVARCCSDNTAIRYVLPVLWMTSCFRKMVPTEQNQRRHYVSPSWPGGGTGAKLLSTIALFWAVVSIRPGWSMELM